MAVAADKIYQAVKSGRVKIDDLNNESKQALRSYVQTKISTPTPKQNTSATPPLTKTPGSPRISNDYNKLFGTTASPNPLKTDVATINNIVSTGRKLPQPQKGAIQTGLDAFNAYSHAIQDPLVNSLTLGGSNLAKKAGGYLGDKVGQLTGATPAEIAAGHQRQAQYDAQQQQLVPETARNVLGTVGNVAGSIGAFGGLTKLAGQPMANLAGKFGLGRLGQAMASNGATMGAYEGINSLTQGNGLAESAKKAGQGFALGAVVGPAGEYAGKAVSKGIGALQPLADRYLPNAATNLLPTAAHYAGNALGGAATGLGFSYGGNLLEGQPLNNAEAGKNAAALALLNVATGGRYREPASPLKMSDINRAYGSENPNRITVPISEQTPLPKVASTNTLDPSLKPILEANGGQAIASNANVTPEFVAPQTETVPNAPIPETTPTIAPKPRPEVMRNAFRGANGMVRIQFPDAYHADLFDFASKLKRVGRGNNPLRLEPGYIEHTRANLAKNLGIAENQVYKVANEYSDSVRASIKGLEEGSHFKAHDIHGKVTAEIIPPKPITLPGQAKGNAPEVILQPSAGVNREQTITNATAPLPKSKPEQPLLRGFVETLTESPKPAEEIKQGILQNLKSRYTPITNEQTVAKANARIAKGIDTAESYVMNSKVLTAEHVATAHRLIDEYQKTGDFEKAVNVAEKIAEQGTRAGQSIQAYSIYDRLSPQGILVHAQRIVARANEQLPVGQEPVKVTPQIAAELTDLASTVQTMTGTKQVATDVINIMERAKAGEKLTDAETQTIKQFVNEAKQFVDKVKPMPQPKARAPRPIKDARIRDNLVSFMDAQEVAARERIAKAQGRISSTPVDVYGDYAIIGASKMAKGVVKFADWAEAMVKDFGEEIRPHLSGIYDKAVGHLNLSAKKVSAKTISQAEKLAERAIKSSEITGEDATTLRDLAQKVSALSGDTKIQASQDLQAVLQGLSKATFGQKVSTVQTIAQLLNPKTIVRNSVGNELFYRMERLNKYVAAPIDWGRVKLFGGQRQVTFRTGNQGEYWKNWLKGWQAGMKGVNPEGIATQYDLRPNTFTNKLNPLTYLEKVTGATLKSFDYAAYKRAANHTLGEMGTLDAINKGLEGEAKAAHIESFMRNADDNIKGIADEYGRYVTFQDNNLLSVGLGKLKRGLNFGKDFGVGDLVLKYPRTPGALLMRSLEYSPAGFLRSAHILAGPLLRGTAPDSREALLALSRAIIGTFGLTGMGMFLANNGVLTAASSKDADIRELQAMSGKNQYQVNATALSRFVASAFDPVEAKPKEGDTLISYDWAAPLALSLALGAGANQTMKKKDGNAIYNAGAGAIQTMTEQSVLSGVKRFFETVPGETGVADKLLGTLADAPASFTPTFFNQLRQLSDNTQRLTNAESKDQLALNKVKNKFPGMQKSLPVAYGTLGKPKEVYQGGSNNWFNVFLNPSFVSSYNLTPEAKLVTDLIDRTGNTQLAPRTAPKSFTVDGEKITLTPKQLSEMQRILGEEIKNRLGKINPNSSDKANAKRVEKALNDSGARAKKLLLKEIKGGL